VYVVTNSRQPLYVGESFNVKDRVDQMLNTGGWRDLDPQSVQVVDHSDPAERHGLQSILIARTDPVFNSHLLRPEVEAVV
jgi:hypothetical protein